MADVCDAAGRPLDVVALAGLQVACIVGVYGSERRKPQPLQVDVRLYLDRGPADDEGLSATVDYAQLAGELRFLLERARFRTLEGATEALLRYLLAPPTADVARAPVQAATVRLTKPQALGGLAVPTVERHRHRADYVYEAEEKPFGRVDLLYVTPSLGIYRLRVKPGACIPTHVHRVMEEHELVLGSGLLLQGRPVARGTAFAWPHDFPHRYDNPAAIEQTVLCIDSPAFIAADEVEVSVPAAELIWSDGVRYYPGEDAPGAAVARAADVVVAA